MGAGQSVQPDRLKTRIFLKLYNQGDGVPVREQLQTAFDKHDTDNSSQISKEELEAAAVALGFEANKDATNAIFLAMDEDGSGEIDFEEFMAMMRGGKK